MSTYVLSDIHGCRDKYLAMRQKIALCAEDSLYIIGDVIDRGPDSLLLLNEVLEDPQVTMLIGNHEWMMYNAITKTDEHLMQLWFCNGGQQTYHDFSNLSSMQQYDIIECLANMLVVVPSLMVNGCDFYLAHSTFIDAPYMEPKRVCDLTPQEVEHVVWAREYPYQDITSAATYATYRDKILVTGHTMTNNFLPLTETADKKCHIFYGSKGHFIDLDCGCAAYACGYSYGRLGCLRLEDMKEYYT